MRLQQPRQMPRQPTRRRLRLRRSVCASSKPKRTLPLSNLNCLKVRPRDLRFASFVCLSLILAVTVLKLELLQNETPENVADIWKKYHKEKYTVASVTSAAVYERIHSKLREFPLFIIPCTFLSHSQYSFFKNLLTGFIGWCFSAVPKEQGAEFFWMQVQDNMMLFTRLIEYKVRKEQAKPALIVAHYTELAADKDVRAPGVISNLHDSIGAYYLFFSLF
jgi:ATP synthase mitochondrial F1 complex assembly factor 1